MELMSLFFNTLYNSTTVFLASFMLRFHDFLVLFSFSTKVFLLYTSCVLRLKLFKYLKHHFIKKAHFIYFFFFITTWIGIHFFLG
jgi:hypothetical protein